MTLKEHIINAAAATVLIAGGSQIVSTKVELARQDERIQRIEDLNNSVDGLRSDLQRVDGKLERLEGRLESSRAHS